MGFGAMAMAAVQAAQTGLSAYNQNVQGKRANSIANANATIMDQQADATMANAEQDMFREHANQNRAVSAELAQEANSGFTDAGSGSAGQMTAMQAAQRRINDIGDSCGE